MVLAFDADILRPFRLDFDFELVDFRDASLTLDVDERLDTDFRDASLLGGSVDADVKLDDDSCPRIE